MTADVKSEVVEDPSDNLQPTAMEDIELLTTHVGGPDFAFVDDIEGCRSNAVCYGIEPSKEMNFTFIPAKWSYPKCLSIMVALRIIAAGLARLVPMIS